MRLRIEHIIDGRVEDVFEKESEPFKSQGELVTTYLTCLISKMSEDEQVCIYFVK